MVKRTTGAAEGVWFFEGCLWTPFGDFRHSAPVTVPGPFGPGGRERKQRGTGVGGIVHVNLGEIVRLVGIFDVIG